MKILLLEDDFVLNEIIEEFLEEQGYEVTVCFDGESAQELLYSKTFDLLLLDVNVPNINGFTLLKELREKEIKTPAIFITSANLLEDMEEGFRSGCDDYIKKPFELKELNLRIENQKRLHNISSSNIIKIDENILLDSSELKIINHGKEKHLAKKEFEVLSYLIKNHMRHVSIEELCNNIWIYEEIPSDSTIRTYIKNIRKYIGEEYISNTRGIGYRFNKK
ncbi:response regulator transcription factor [Arcobacter sp. YIC-464]|uniref:response regulator transcription factor n=1 Tax=Arcobacter sp. YIC-464 TaxID=3376631 RepID=UPI003C1B9FC0